MQLCDSLAFLDEQFEFFLIIFFFVVIMNIRCGHIRVLLDPENIARSDLGDALVRAAGHGEDLIREAVAEEDGLRVHAACLVCFRIFCSDRYSTIAVHVCQYIIIF